MACQQAGEGKEGSGRGGGGKWDALPPQGANTHFSETSAEEIKWVFRYLTQVRWAYKT